MAHIADFLVDTSNSVGLNNYIARELSPPRQDVKPKTPPPETPSDEEKKHVWRMHQPSEPRKFQLFPSKEKLSITAGRKSPDSDSVLSMGQNEKDRSLLSTAIRSIKPKEQTLIRRRKVSVPELGPMTTVQEIAMDSPTIPGRPPIHERSTSAPGNSWRQHVFGESMLACISGPALDESMEIASNTHEASSSDHDSQNTTPRPIPTPRQPLSPKMLAPLVIPTSSAPQPRLANKSSSSWLRMGNETPGPDVPPKSARMLEFSPNIKTSPFTALTTPSSSTSLVSASTAPTSITSTPLSAPAFPQSASEGRSSPKPWKIEGRSSPKPWPSTTSSSLPQSTTTHTRNQSETTTRPGNHTFSHRRGESEGGSSIMDRGRPKKRTGDLSSSPLRRKPSIHSTTTHNTPEEQKAFETLPSGIRASDVSSQMSPTEIDILRKQAIGQASRFEILNAKDVEDLSRELRALDERCTYLRTTHRSLRSGRRNLHSRICTYLRSPRTARFSHESILKQEEALSELDSSIDDWVSKLEAAENRRTRVRQKLLEHVAGALLLPAQSPGSGEMGRRREQEMNTPPRSPVKEAYKEKDRSPVRLAAEVEVSTPEEAKRREVESIRIYADSDVYALLADVEAEITRMSSEGERDKEGRERNERGERAKEAGVMLNAVAFEGLTGSPARNNAW